MCVFLAALYNMDMATSTICCVSTRATLHIRGTWH